MNRVPNDDIKCDCALCAKLREMMGNSLGAAFMNGPIALLATRLRDNPQLQPPLSAKAFYMALVWALVCGADLAVASELHRPPAYWDAPTYWDAMGARDWATEIYNQLGIHREELCE